MMRITPSFILPLFGSVNLSGTLLAVFFLCLISVSAFEFVNGFHDTANAVATVIYTKTLKPVAAIIWSGIWNFLGVFVIGTAVAMSLLKLVPLEQIISLPVKVGACLVIAILIGSIIWNVSTWLLGIPLSSSHTLIGAMIGASIGFTHYYAGAGVNWDKAKEIGLSLLISPVIGFIGSVLLMRLEKKWIKYPRLFHIPEGDDDTPPLPVKILLVTTCTLVSFFHGSNDGQKGVGLMMLVLIAFLPGTFILNNTISTRQINGSLSHIEQTLNTVPATDPSVRSTLVKLKQLIAQTKPEIGHKDGDEKKKFVLKKHLQEISTAVKNLTENKKVKLDSRVDESLEKDYNDLQKITDYAPIWVLFVVSLSLGFGTMIGWRRIVVTIGEKIGNQNLNYAQGATAEIVAAATIGLSTGFGLPVSTTHVLSSGVAGAMVATEGVKNLNKSTIKNIALAWLLTLPVAIALGFLIFMLLHLLVK